MSQQKSVKIVSLDVFDTVLARAVGSPESSFLLLANKALSLNPHFMTVSPEIFARARAAAEARVFYNAGGIDSKVDLHQIYAELRDSLGLTEEDCDFLIRLEIDLENELNYSAPKAEEIIHKAREQKKKIVFLSDMYLGEKVIYDLLSKRGLCLENDRCYVSSDHAKSKQSGKLFQEFINVEGIEPSQACHVGNNTWSDVYRAKENGLNVLPFLEGNLNKHEEILESFTWATGGLSSAMAGASRLARLTINATSEKEALLRDISASVASPTVVSFLLWALKRAQQKGLKRLYFVSRDGQVLLEVAKRLIDKLNFHCDLRYLYGSRQAWLLPSLTEVNETSLEGIFTGKLKLDVNFISVKIALDRLDIKPEDIKPNLDAIGLTELDWSRNLNGDERQALYDLVLTDKGVHHIILKKAAESRQVMLKYLEQEGMLEPVPFGLVDLGTGASLHYALSAVLDSVGKRGPVSFYLGSRGNSLEIPFGQPESYLFNKSLGLGFYDVQGINEILEMVCSADHGTVLTYRDMGDRVEPALKHHDNQPVMNWGFNIVRETIFCFADYIILDPSLLNVSADMRKAVVTTLEEFWKNPSPQEASAWGSFPMEDGWGNESFYHCLAQPYEWQQVAYVLWYGRRPTRRHWWHEGAFAQTPRFRQAMFNSLLQIGKKQRSIRKKLELGRLVKHLLKRKRCIYQL